MRQTLLKHKRSAPSIHMELMLRHFSDICHLLFRKDKLFFFFFHPELEPTKYKYSQIILIILYIWWIKFNNWKLNKNKSQMCCFFLFWLTSFFKWSARLSIGFSVVWRDGVRWIHADLTLVKNIAVMFANWTNDWWKRNICLIKKRPEKF